MNSVSSSISLYIHIPFCHSKCSYCDFYSESCGFERIPRVIDEIINQLNSRYLKVGSPDVKTVFIGGGTPSMIDLDSLDRLLKAISVIAESPDEWTIEANPETITAEFLNTLKNYQVNRLSIGVQTFNDQLLKTLGRKASLTNIETALNLVKKEWNREFSIDLISSLPGQSEELVKKDIELALEYNPDHISFYALSVEEGTLLEDKISKGEIDEPEPELSENIWITGRSLLNNHGYENYEVSNYTRENPSIHNINYWELKPYLGIGPGAVSTIVNKDGKIVRISNKKSIEEFLKGHNNRWGEEVTYITPKEFLEDYIMMGFRLSKGIDRSRFYKIFGKDIVELVPGINKFSADGLIIESPETVRLSDLGFDIMNSILVELLESLENIEVEEVNWFY